MGRRYHYHVYVILLSPEVLYEPRFCKANPDYVAGRPCVYVGMTGLDPDLRFDKHKAGIQSNRYVFEFGLRLMPELYDMYNPMPYDGARDGSRTRHRAARIGLRRLAGLTAKVVEPRL